MFEGILNNFIHKKVINIQTIRDIAVTSDAPKFHKNINKIITVIISSVVSIQDKVLIESLIRLVLS
ncbi:MAG: hypothetical protein ACPHY8_04225 [Patescibacteria group bacterium]